MIPLVPEFIFVYFSFSRLPTVLAGGAARHRRWASRQVLGR